MLGLIVIAADKGCGLRAEELFQDFLGAPLLARAIASAIPTQEAVTAVLVVPDALVARARADIVERFGLDEVDRVVGGGTDRRDALAAGLSALPSDVDVVLVQEGARILVPLGLADKIAQSARASGAAAPVAPVAEPVVRRAGERIELVPDEGALAALQGPQGFARSTLAAAADLAEPGFLAEALVASAAGVGVTCVDGDPDNRLIENDADVSRAIEVFARRALDFPFLYPVGMLPDIDDVSDDPTVPGDETGRGPR